MSRFALPRVGQLLSSVIFFALSLLFFIINISASPVAYIQLNIQLKKFDSQKIQLAQANFRESRPEQTQVEKTQSKQARLNQGNWIQLKQGQLQEIQFKLNRAELSQSEQIQSPLRQAGQSQFKQSQDQQNQSLQTQSQQTQSQQTQTEQAQQAKEPSPGPKQTHFYNVDTERKIEGTIQEIVLEPRYEERLPFLMIVIKEKKTGEIYKVEVSPAWFFNYDLHKGESIKIVGSFYSQNNENFLIARELQVGGETFRVRDSRGFPNWRGGPMKGKVRRIRGK